jgi:hypothetical protein
MAFDFNSGSRPKTPTVPPRPSSSPAPPPPVGKSHSGGFQNRPERRDPSAKAQVPVPAPPSRRASERGPSRPPVHRAPLTGLPSSIPWNFVITVLGIIAVVVFLWLFRDVITAFLSQVLSWILTIVIILGILKFFLFPRR